MAAAQPDASQDGPLDTLQALQQNHDSSSSHTRRLRPPTIESFASDANRVPLRQGKVQRRESRMGLRSLFSRSKTTKDVDQALGPEQLRPAGGSFRGSIVDFSSWPHALHASRSEAHLPTIPQPERTSTTGSNKSLPPLPTIALPPKRAMATAGKDKAPNPIPPKPSSRGSVATWDPPPLFQAYPQAIRHAHLPAPVLSADALLRQNTKKGADANLLEELNQTTTTLDQDEQSSNHSQSPEKVRKRHKRNVSNSSIKLDWTTKVYVLVTSGYLLQYTGEGQFDRLPEKILHLGKSSAAFASDSIPGRHWVLQVCSSMEPDGTPASDSRSLFSRMPFRAEKRSASNFLMVFEDADDMESWIVLLRREIEALGGKKNLSETGKPKIVEALVSGSLRPQTSQRTLVVRDPERFSRVISPDQVPWGKHSFDGSEQRPDTPDQAFDDVSTTTSIASHDGRQLENLRDSGNRLSYLSSGQRTMITSTGSSPAPSPVRESFSFEKDDPKPHAISEVVPEAQPRPNAALINNRRQSMQSLSPIIDCRPIRPPSRPQSTTPDSGPNISSPQTIPHFSVPNSVGRRYSFIRSPTAEGGQFPPPPLHAREPLLKGLRKSPPTSLPMTRPLSTVADQPSPNSPPLKESTPRNLDGAVVSEAPDSATIFTSWSHEATRQPQQAQPPPNERQFPSRRSSFMPAQDDASSPTRTSPRRFSSMQTLRSAAQSPAYTIQPPTFNIGQAQGSPAPTGDIRSRSPTPRKKSTRASMMSLSSANLSAPQLPAIASNRPLQRAVEVTVTEFDSRDVCPRSRHMSVMGSMSKSQQCLVPGAARNLYNRRSMPQLIEGPPPAPPPNCALPPIPQKHTKPGAPHWKTLRL